jgi:hypothetical protein
MGRDITGLSAQMCFLTTDYFVSFVLFVSLW